jgi:hypothetical protein
LDLLFGNLNDTRQDEVENRQSVPKPPVESSQLIRRKLAEQSLSQKGITSTDPVRLAKLLDRESEELHALYQKLMTDRYAKILRDEKMRASKAM